MKTEPTEAYRMIEEDWYAIPYMGTDYPQDPDIVVDKKDVYEIAKKAFQEGQSSPKIKQLEWGEDVLFADMIVSDGFSLQFYEIKIIDNTLYIGDTEQSFKTIDEAKAAAQADFEKRVKECLE